MDEYYKLEAEKKDRHAKWLKGLKVGDTVVVPARSFYGSEYSRYRIERATGKQFVCVGWTGGNEIRVRKEDGRVVGASYCYVEEYTDEVKSVIKHRGLVDRVQDLLYKTKIDQRSVCLDLSDEVLEKITKVLREVSDERAAKTAEKEE